MNEDHVPPFSAPPPVLESPTPPTPGSSRGWMMFALVLLVLLAVSLLINFASVFTKLFSRQGPNPPALSPAGPSTLPVPSYSVPTHFSVYYPFEPAGKRYWNSGGSIWIEQYDSGRYGRFIVTGRDSVDGATGTLIVMLSKGATTAPPESANQFQIFIPDLGSPHMRLWARSKKDGEWKKWSLLNKMEEIE